MALKNDLSNLPKPASARTDGRPPDEYPTFLATVAKRLEEGRKRKGVLPHAVEGTAFRHSDAAKCARALSFKFAGIAPTEAPDASGLWNFAMGDYGHEVFQGAVQRYLGENAQVEVTCFDPGTPFASGHADAEIVTDDGAGMVVYELKTVGGFAYKMAVGERGAAQGPKHEHIVQGALNASARGADRLVIGYLSKEAISVQAAAKKKIDELGRFMAEWTFERDVFEPMAAAERARVKGILDLVVGGQLAARKIPDPELPSGAVIVDPSTGRWELVVNGSLQDTGSWWACGYCDFRSLCAQTPSGRCSVNEVPVELRGAA
jgi:hypothetical protein